MGKRAEIFFILVLLLLAGCRGDEIVIPSEQERVEISPMADPNLLGIYLLNEGNMGSNKCTLDFLDFSTGTYWRNIYPERNPNVAKELGDVGNDIGIYGSKMYIVVNCSHKVEVVDSRSGVRIGQVDIPNCRCVRFHDGKAYVSSYVGPVAVGLDSPKGAVYEVDTLSLKITRTVTVGYQPDGMEIVDGMLYVANSGGYRPPEYDNTISVIRLSDFRAIRRIEVAKNPGRIKKDGRGRLWVSSRGDTSAAQGCLQLIASDKITGKMEVVKSFDIPVGNMDIHDDKLYYFTSAANGAETVTYGVIDLSTCEILTDNFISDGSDRLIAVPYALSVLPESGNILISDAKNYVSSGTLFCFSPDGVKLWSIRTGDIPAHIAFLNR